MPDVVGDERTGQRINRVGGTEVGNGGCFCSFFFADLGEAVQIARQFSLVFFVLNGLRIGSGVVRQVDFLGIFHQRPGHDGLFFFLAGLFVHDLDGGFHPLIQRAGNGEEGVVGGAVAVVAGTGLRCAVHGDGSVGSGVNRVAQIAVIQGQQELILALGAGQVGLLGVLMLDHLDFFARDRHIVVAGIGVAGGFVVLGIHDEILVIHSIALLDAALGGIVSAGGAGEIVHRIDARRGGLLAVFLQDIGFAVFGQLEEAGVAVVLMQAIADELDGLEVDDLFAVFVQDGITLVVRPRHHFIQAGDVALGVIIHVHAACFANDVAAGVAPDGAVLIVFGVQLRAFAAGFLVPDGGLVVVHRLITFVGEESGNLFDRQIMDDQVFFVRGDIDGGPAVPQLGRPHADVVPGFGKAEVIVHIGFDLFALVRHHGGQHACLMGGQPVHAVQRVVDVAGVVCVHRNAHVGAGIHDVERLIVYAVRGPFIDIGTVVAVAPVGAGRFDPVAGFQEAQQLVAVLIGAHGEHIRPVVGAVVGVQDGAHAELLAARAEEGVGLAVGGAVIAVLFLAAQVLEHVFIELGDGAVFRGGLAHAVEVELVAGLIPGDHEVVHGLNLHHVGHQLVHVVPDQVVPFAVHLEDLEVLIGAVLQGDTHLDAAVEQALLVHPGGGDGLHQHFKGGAVFHVQLAGEQVDGHALADGDHIHLAVLVLVEGIVRQGGGNAALLDAGHVALAVHVEHGAVGQLVGGNAAFGIIGDLVIGQHIQAADRVLRRQGDGGAGIVFQGAGQRDGNGVGVGHVEVAAFLQRQIHVALGGGDAVQIHHGRGPGFVLDDAVLQAAYVVELHGRHVEVHAALGGDDHVVGIPFGVGGHDPGVEGMRLVIAHLGGVPHHQAVGPQRAHALRAGGIVHGDHRYAIGAQQPAARFARPLEGGAAIVQRDHAVQGDVPRAGVGHGQLRRVMSVQDVDAVTGAVLIDAGVHEAFVAEDHVAQRQAAVGVVGDGDLGQHGLVVHRQAGDVAGQVGGAGHEVADVAQGHHGVGDAPDFGLVLDAHLAHHAVAVEVVADIDVDTRGGVAQVQDGIGEGGVLADGEGAFVLLLLADEAAHLLDHAGAVFIVLVDGGVQVGAVEGEAAVHLQGGFGVAVAHIRLGDGFADGVQLHAGFGADVLLLIRRSGGSVQLSVVMGDHGDGAYVGGGVDMVGGVVGGVHVRAHGSALGVSVHVLGQLGDAGAHIHPAAFDLHLAAALAQVDHGVQGQPHVVLHIRRRAQTGSVGGAVHGQAVLGRVGADVDIVVAVEDRNAVIDVDLRRVADGGIVADGAQRHHAAAHGLGVGADAVGLLAVVGAAQHAQDVHVAEVRGQRGVGGHGDFAGTGQVVFSPQTGTLDEAAAGGNRAGVHAGDGVDLDVQVVAGFQDAADINGAVRHDGVGALGIVGAQAQADGVAVGPAFRLGVILGAYGQVAAGGNVGAALDVGFRLIIAGGGQHGHADRGQAQFKAALDIGFGRAGVFRAHVQAAAHIDRTAADTGGDALAVAAARAYLGAGPAAGAGH